MEISCYAIRADAPASQQKIESNKEKIQRRAAALIADGKNADYAMNIARREVIQSRLDSWSDSDKQRVSEYATKKGLRLDEASSYAAAVCAVCDDKDLNDETDPAKKRCAELNIDPESWKNYSRVCGEIYFFDSESGGTKLKPEFARLSRRGQ